MKFTVEKSVPILALSKVAAHATTAAGLASISYFWMDDEDVVGGANGGVLRGVLIARSTDMGGNAVGISVSTPSDIHVEIEAVPGRAAFKLQPRREGEYCSAESRTIEVLKGGEVAVGSAMFGTVK